MRFLPPASLSILLLGLLACAPSEPPLNVLLVTFDTTRADHLSVYGGPALTPNLEALAADGIVFENAISPVPITLPSHSSLMTGKVPFAHGVRDNGLFKLGEEQETLAEALSQAGYGTAAAVGSFPLTAQFGIGQGFDLFDDHVTGSFEDFYGDRVLPKKQLFFDERPAGQVNAALLPWLEAHAAEPFFAWAHYFDPHLPHTPPPPLNQIYAHDLYAGEIAYSDESLGVLIATLKERGVYDRTVIVVTSDHGESRGEHNEATHSLLAYNSTLHVPLVIKPPAGYNTGVRIEQRVGLIDIFPTVLDWLGLAVPDNVQGRSLVSLIADPDAPQRQRVLYAETLSPSLSQGWGELRALFEQDLKYIHGPRPELFDLSEDPKEVRDLIRQQPDEAHRLRDTLQAYLERHQVPGIDSSAPIDEETSRRLAALGYLRAPGEETGPLVETLTQEGDPPQDRAISIAMYSHAKQLMFDGRWLDARESLERLLRLDPDNGHYTELLATALARLGQVDEALETLQSIPHDAAIPSRSSVLTTMGHLLLAKGDLQGALERFRDSQILDRTAEGQWTLATLYGQQSDPVQQRRHLEASLEQDHTFVPALLDSAVLVAQDGQVDEARARFEKALEAHPFFPRAHFNYGVFWLAQGDRDAALERFHRAVELDPSYHQARVAVVEILWQDGLEDAALEQYLELVERAPGSNAAALAAEIMGLTL